MRPQIIFEISHQGPQRLGLAQDGAWSLLKEWGYEFFIIEQNGSLTSLVSPRVGNVLAIPRDTTTEGK